MKKNLYLLLIMIAVPLWGQQTERKYTDHYYERLKTFRQEPSLDSESIVMLGNSLVEFGGDWAQRLGDTHVVNRGIVENH